MEEKKKDLGLVSFIKKLKPIQVSNALNVDRGNGSRRKGSLIRKAENIEAVLQKVGATKITVEYPEDEKDHSIPKISR